MVELYWLQGPVPETTKQPAEMPPSWGETGVVGKPSPQRGRIQTVSGSAVYPLDVIVPDMLHAAILRCPHAHAKVKKVDTSAAAKMPGVRGPPHGRLAVGHSRGSLAGAHPRRSSSTSIAVTRETRSRRSRPRRRNRHSMR